MSATRFNNSDDEGSHSKHLDMEGQERQEKLLTSKTRKRKNKHFAGIALGFGAASIRNSAPSLEIKEDDLNGGGRLIGNNIQSQVGNNFNILGEIKEEVAVDRSYDRNANRDQLQIQPERCSRYLSREPQDFDYDSQDADSEEEEEEGEDDTSDLSE